MIIFPEYKENYNHVVNRFHDGFVSVAKLYYKKTGKEVSFVPMESLRCGKIDYQQISFAEAKGKYTSSGYFGKQVPTVDGHRIKMYDITANKPGDYAEIYI